MISGRTLLILTLLNSEVVANLQPSLILDNLRGKGLVTREEYSNLRKSTELEQARILVNDLLPRKGKDSLDKFCSTVSFSRQVDNSTL